MRLPSILVVVFLMLALAAFLQKTASAAAQDCSAFRYHVSLAAHALVEADVYSRENNDDLTKVNYDISTHELDVADEYGSAQSCLPGKTYNSFWATTFHHDVYDLIYLNPTKARATEIVKDTGVIANTLQASDGAEAYADAMNQYRTMKSLASVIRAPEVPKKADPCQSDAKVLHAVFPEEPRSAQEQGISGDVAVMITLDETSKIVSATIQKSPSSLLNQAALNAALESTFQTRVVDCKPVGGTFTYVLSFQTQ
jgi:TonB family protein